MLLLPKVALISGVIFSLTFSLLISTGFGLSGTFGDAAATRGSFINLISGFVSMGFGSGLSLWVLVRI